MKLREVAVSGICTAWTGQLIWAASMAPGCGPLTPMRGNNSPARGAASPHDHDQLEHQSLRKGSICGIQTRPPSVPPSIADFSDGEGRGAWLLPGLITVGRAMAA